MMHLYAAIMTDSLADSLSHAETVPIFLDYMRLCSRLKKGLNQIRELRKAATAYHNAETL
jgi:hypothetical protein